MNQHAESTQQFEYQRVHFIFCGISKCHDKTSSKKGALTKNMESFLFGLSLTI
ncbi:unnamed protein product [Brassica rapa subsp. trilocularis]